jgi:hypothetical protein
MIRLIVICMGLYFVSACSSTSPIKQREGYIDIVVSIPLGNKKDGGDQVGAAKPAPVYILNVSHADVSLCNIPVLVNRAVSFSIQSIRKCGGSAALENELNKKKRTIKPMKNYASVWVVEDIK